MKKEGRRNVGMEKIAIAAIILVAFQEMWKNNALVIIYEMEGGVVVRG